MRLLAFLIFPSLLFGGRSPDAPTSVEIIPEDNGRKLYDQNRERVSIEQRLRQEEYLRSYIQKKEASNLSDEDPEELLLQ